MVLYSSQRKDRVTKFFLQVLTQPNARVLVNFKDNESGKLLLTTPWDYSLDSIERIYDNGVDDGSFDKTRLTKDEQLKMGQVITQYADAPKWFDEIAYQLLLSDRYEEQLRASATPVIKVVGRRLNSAKAKISDPQHPYSNERDVLGIWYRPLDSNATASYAPYIPIQRYSHLCCASRLRTYQSYFQRRSVSNGNRWGGQCNIGSS